MKFLDILKEANQNLLRNKGRTLLTILAIFIGSFVIIIANAIAAGVNKYVDDQINAIGGDGYIEFMTKSTYDTVSSYLSTASGEIQEYNPDKNSQTALAITNEQVEKLKQIPGIKTDTLMLLGGNAKVDYITGGKTDKKYLIASVGLTPSESLQFQRVAGKGNDPFSSEYQIEISLDYAKALGYDNPEDAIDQTVKLAVQDPFTKSFTEIEGRVTAVMANGLMASMSPVRLNLAYNDRIYDESTKYLPTDQKNAKYTGAVEYDYENYSAKEIKDALDQIGLAALTVEDEVGMFKTFLDVMVAVLDVFGGIALLAAAIGIINTLFMSVQERTREIGLDKALGMSSSKVFLSFSLEAIMLGFWGSAFGVILSIILGTIVDNILHASGAVLESFPTFHVVAFTPENIIPIVATVMMIAFLAGTLPARRAARKNPIDALRYE
jgi:putative ABC transport system permease protein